MGDKIKIKLCVAEHEHASLLKEAERLDGLAQRASFNGSLSGAVRDGATWTTWLTMRERNGWRMNGCTDEARCLKASADSAVLPRCATVTQIMTNPAEPFTSRATTDSAEWVL